MLIGFRRGAVFLYPFPASVGDADCSCCSCLKALCFGSELRVLVSKTWVRAWMDVAQNPEGPSALIPVSTIPCPLLYPLLRKRD